MAEKTAELKRKNRSAMKQAIIILSFILINSCAVQKNLNNKENTNPKLPEKELYLLNENEYDSTYLISVMHLTSDEVPRKNKPIENIGLFLLYYTETRRKNPNDKYGGYTSYILHITPESKGRFRIDRQTGIDGIYRYIDIETRKPDSDFNFELTYQWDFAGYSDDTDSEEAKLLKYWYTTEIQNAKTNAYTDYVRSLLPHYME